jgi:serine/threonine protein kinase/tetratricopeptide (TPR) repeat protein
MSAVGRTEESIFAEALDQPSAKARAAFLEAACSGDAGMRVRLEKLLKSHTDAGSFLRKPLVATAEQISTEGPGTVIGPYKLLQEIGEGGMGVVYMAEQESPVRRRVALKIIKPGMDSRQVIARFEAERQALAMMDHQNIAKVLDAGTVGQAMPDKSIDNHGRQAQPDLQGGRPYFVMELVHGVPLTKFCEDNRLTLRERLELFIPVCHAIQHAHQKGIIHRDIKPSNVLVTMYDDNPVPKVIDFGVAKALEQRLTEKTLFTQFGTLVGTFEYMSPEQAEMNAFGVDTRSDVYSLGVLLYELLTGTTPIERQRLREAALDELVRLIKEEEAPRPSVRLSTSGALPKVAAAFKTAPARLSQLVRGELDWIVMKCLEKDRTRRYETVNGLSRDVQRYLADEPVEACPPSLTYRLRKFARKHRGLLTTAASFAALLLIGAIVSTALAAWAIRAQQNLELSLENERKARQEAVAAKEAADQAAERLRTATQVANDGIEYYNRRNWSAAHEHFTRAMRIEKGLNTPYVYRGALYTQLGLWDRAAADYTRRFQLANRANAETWFDFLLLKAFTGDEAGYREACQEMLRQHGGSAELRNRYCVVRSCLLMSKPLGDAGELVSKAEALAAEANAPWYVGLAGRAHLLAGDSAKAEARCREAITLGAGGPNGVHRVNYANLALALHEQDKPVEAKEALAVADQAKDQWAATMQAGLVGTMPSNWCDWLEFLNAHRQATIKITGSPPAVDPRLAAHRERAIATVSDGDVFTFMDTGREHVRRHAWDQAAGSFAQVLDQLPPGFRGASQEMRFCVEMVQQAEVFERLVKLRPKSLALRFARGRYHASAREWTRAAAEYRKSLDLLAPQLTEAGAERGPWIGWCAMNGELGAVLLLADDRAGYEEVCKSVIETPGILELAIVLSGASRACTMAPDAMADFSQPLDWANYAVEKQRRIAWFQFGLGIAQHRAGRHEEAISSLKRSLAVNETWVGRGQNFAALALAHHALGRDQEAGQWLKQTRSWLKATDRSAAGWPFGYAASDFLSDWLCAQVLLREAEKLITY